MQLVDHGIVANSLKHNALDGHSVAFRQLIIAVQFKLSLRAVIGHQRIHTADHRRMGNVARLRIQHGAAQHIRREGAVDIRAFAVILHLAARSDHADRIGRVIQQTQLIEEGTIFRADRDGQVGIVKHAHALESLRAVLVIRRAQQARAAIGRAADFRHLSGSVQQDRKCIVARRNRRAIGVTQILAQGQRIGAIALAILGFHQAGNHTVVEHVAALIAVPFYQMIAMQQRLHIQIAGIAAKRQGEEVAAQGRGGTHHQFVFPSGRHSTYRTERQHQCKKTCHYSFHGSFPFSVSDKCFQVSVNLSFRDLPRHALLRAGGISAYSKHSPAFRYDLKPRLVSSSGTTISPSPT